MKQSILVCHLLLVGVMVAACGGGGSSSGSGVAVAPAPAPAPVPVDPDPVTIAGEFAKECMSDIQVRRNRTALVMNICPYDINVGQMNSRFPDPPPITLVAAGQIRAVALADDQLSIGFGACKAPSIPQPASPGFFRCSSYTQGKQMVDEVQPLLYVR